MGQANSKLTIYSVHINCVCVCVARAGAILSLRCLTHQIFSWISFNFLLGSNSHPSFSTVCCSQFLLALGAVFPIHRNSVLRVRFDCFPLVFPSGFFVNQKRTHKCSVWSGSSNNTEPMSPLPTTNFQFQFIQLMRRSQNKYMVNYVMSTIS